MGNTDSRPEEPEDASERALAHRVGQALDARAHLKTITPSSMGQRLAQLHATVGGAAGEPDGADAEVFELGRAAEAGPAARAHWSRLALAVVACAAAAVVIAAAVLAVARANGDSQAPTAPPASSSSTSSTALDEAWLDYSGLYHQQWLTERDGAAAFDDDVVPGSVRILAQLGEFAYWAGFSHDGRLCWRVEGPDADSGGCSPDGSAPRMVQVSDGSTAPQVWLVPYDTPTSETDPLTADGLVEWTRGVWVDAGALTPPADRFERFRDAPTATDVVPADSAIVVRDPLVADSLRLFYTGDVGTVYAAYQRLGKICLFWEAPYPGLSASTCQTPEYLAGEGFTGVRRTEDTYGTAWLVSDDLDTSSWAARGRVQLAKNLWFEAISLSDPAPPTPASEPAPSPSPSPSPETATPTEQPTSIPFSGSPAPELLGFTEAEAAAVLEMRGMELGEVIVQDAGSAPSGIIIETSPPAGAPVPEGTAVDVVISR